MSNFRDFLFNRDPSAAWALVLAMTGVRLGERQLLVGDDAELFALLAGKAGLTGRVSVVVFSEAARARVEAAAAESGVLIEDLRTATPPDLPIDVGAYDVAIVNAGPAFLALPPADQEAVARSVHAGLRGGGRMLIVEGQPPRWLGLRRPKAPGLVAFEESGGAVRVLEAAGFSPVRQLAAREGQRFTEGIKYGPAK